MPPIKANSPKKLQIGTFLHFEGSTFQISTTLNGLALDVIDVATSERKVINLTELYKSEGGYIHSATLAELKTKLTARIVPASPPPESALPENLLKFARHIVETVQRVEYRVAAREHEIAEHGRTNILREEVSKENIGISTFYNYRKRFDENSGNTLLLAASLHRSTFDKPELTKAQQHFLDTIVCRYVTHIPQDIFKLGEQILQRTSGLWIDPDQCDGIPEDLVEELFDPRIPMDVILNNKEKRQRLIPISFVSRSYFYECHRALRALPDMGKELIDGRYGRGSWDKHFKIFDAFAYHANQPLQYVFADHYLIDVFVVDEETRSEPFRLYFTALIDAYTRSVIGYALLLQYPSADSILSALFNTLWPKDFLAEWGITKPWHGHGIPVQLSLDNAWAHHSKSLEDAARIIGQSGQFNTIDLVFRTPYLARQGALIERYFGNLSQKIKNHLRNKGAIQSSSHTDVRNAVRQAHLLSDDIHWFILNEIVAYQNSPHSSLNKMTPNEKWLEATKLWLPLVPQPTPELLRSFWLDFGETRNLSTERGICAFALHYNSEELQKQPINDKSGKIKYSIRYDPSNITTVAIFRKDTFICEARARQLRRQDGSYRAVSEAELDMAKDIRQALGYSRVLDPDLFKFLDEVEEKSSQRLKEQKKMRKNSKRSMGGPEKKSPQAPAANPASQPPPDNDSFEGYDTFFESFSKKPSDKRSSN